MLTWPDFWFSRLFFGQVGKTALCLKNVSKMNVIFVFGNTHFDQTFTEYVSNQYTHFGILKCQVWLQVMEGSLILLCFLGIFKHYWRSFMSELLYLHQTFTDYVSNQYTHFGLLTCQMWLQVMKCSLIWFRFLGISIYLNVSILKHCNLIKLWQNVCLDIKQNCNMPYVFVYYER